MKLGLLIHLIFMVRRGEDADLITGRARLRRPLALGAGLLAAVVIAVAIISARRTPEMLETLGSIAFGILIYFHSAITFIPGGLPLIQNADTSPALAAVVVFFSQSRISLLYFVAGADIGFSQRSRSARNFVIERTWRLLLPLLGGAALLVPPMVYLEKLHLGEIPPGFFPEFFVNGIYPQGHLSWHHLWFVAHLYLFCLLG